MAKLMVALITPFTKEHEVDYPALRALIARLMAEGSDCRTYRCNYRMWYNSRNTLFK